MIRAMLLKWRPNKRPLLFVFFLLATGCASLPQNFVRQPSFAVSDTSNTSLGIDIGPLARAHHGESGFYALQDGTEAFALRLRLVQNAEKTIDAQYYIWHDDLIGKTLHNQLLHAADRGVRVRLLLDDLDTAGKNDILRILDAHPNIEIRLFNPFSSRKSRLGDFLIDSKRVDHRMHSKSFTVDNQATIFGGRNIGNEYFDAAEDVGFSDLDVLAIGPVVPEVSQAFDLYWNSEWVYPLTALESEKVVGHDEIETFRQQSDEFFESAKSSKYAAALGALDIVQEASVADLDFSWGRWVLIYDQPSKVKSTRVSRQTDLAPMLKEAMDRTREELLIVSPYFVPGKKVTGYLVALVDKGVRVRILTNSLAANDVSLVHAGYMRYRKNLIKGGVELYEFKPTRNTSAARNSSQKRWTGSARASLHGKYFGFDKRYLFVGSFNLDARSMALNTELGAYFESKIYARRLSDSFDQDGLVKAYRVFLTERGSLRWVTLDNGEEVTFDVEPDTSWWKRFSTRLLSIFFPESEL